MTGESPQLSGARRQARASSGADDFETGLRQALQARSHQGLYRQRLTRLGKVQGAFYRLQDGRQLLNFCSNDYLGLSQEPRVCEAVSRAAQCQFGAGASHLVSGHTDVHHALENALALATGRERALLFSTGYMANLGVVTALAQLWGADLVADKLNHASLIDACQLAAQTHGGRFRRYRHADARDAKRCLEQANGPSLLITDGVFSMDGDLAPLAALASLASDCRAVLVVDDAHGFGVMAAGPLMGSPAALGLNPQQVPVYIGTFGKALGGFGAFVAGSAQLIEAMTQWARPYIYTTALPAPVVAGVSAALRLVQTEPQHRERLLHNVALFRSRVADLISPDLAQLLPSQTPIQPLVLGSVERTVAVAHFMAAAGFWVGAIRPPTVPVGGARLRITLNSLQTPDMIADCVACLAKALEASASVKV